MSVVREDLFVHKATIPTSLGRFKLPSVVKKTDLLETQSGMELADDLFHKSLEERQTLEKQSQGLVNRFDRIAARAGDETLKMTTGRMAVIGTITQKWEEEPDYKNCNMIPVVQSRNTRGMMMAVQYWMDNTPKNQQRMWVVSAGWTYLHEYSDRHKELTRTISKVASSKKLKEAGIELVYYAVENTFHRDSEDPGTEVDTDKIELKRDSKGRPMLNLHAHILLRVKRRQSKLDWQEITKWVRGRFRKNYLHDSAIRGGAAEVVKYVFKPAEFRKLSDDELLALYLCTWRRRFHICLGELKEFRCGLEHNKLKLKRRQLDDGAAWCLLEKTGKKKDDDDKETTEDRQDFSFPVAITAPSPKFSNVYEPCIIIKNFDGDFDSLFSRFPFIEQEMRAIQRAAARNRGKVIGDKKSLSFIKDTTTISVQTNPENTSPYLPPPDLGEPEWMANIPETTNQTNFSSHHFPNF